MAAPKDYPWSPGYVNPNTRTRTPRSDYPWSSNYGTNRGGRVGELIGTPMSQTTVATNVNPNTGTPLSPEVLNQIEGNNAETSQSSNDPTSVRSSGFSGYSGSSTGSSTGLAALKAQAEQQLADAKTQIGQFRSDSGPAYDEAMESVRQNYQRAAEQRRNVYEEGVDELSGNLANLGLNFRDGATYADWDQNNRYLQEAADNALANDLSWFEKAKQLEDSVYASFLSDLALTELLMQSGGIGGGSGGGGRRSGGGRRRSGGSSSGGSVTEKGKEDITAYNPEFIANLDSLPNNLQNLAANYLRSAGSSGVVGMLADVNDDFNRVTNVANTYSAVDRALGNAFWNNNPFRDLVGSAGTPPRTFSSAPTRQAQSQQSDLGQLVNYATQYSPNFNPSVVKVQTTTSGSNRR